jgi:hypothetical protein
MLKPTLLRYDDETGIATFQTSRWEYDVPGLSRVGAERATLEIRSRGRYARVVLEYEDTSRTRVVFRGGRPALRFQGGTIEGRPMLRAVAIDEV